MKKITFIFLIWILVFCYEVLVIYLFLTLDDYF